MAGCMRRFVLLLAMAVGLGAPNPLIGQVAPRTYTLDDVLTSLRRGADTLGLATTNPAQDRALDSVSAMLRAAGAAPLTIDALASIIAKRHPSFADVARWSPQPRAAWTEPWFFDALVRLRRIANAAGSGIGPQLVAKFGSTAADLPGVAEDILEDLRQGRLTLEIRQPSLEHASERLGRRLFNGLLLAASVVAFAILFAAGYHLMAWLAIAAGAAWGFLHTIAMALTKSRRR